MGITKKRGKAGKSFGKSDYKKNYNEEPIGILFAIFFGTLLQTVVLGAFISTRVISAILTEIEQWPIYRECARIERAQVSISTQQEKEGENNREEREEQEEERQTTETTEQEQWNSCDQLQRNTYEQNWNIGKAPTYLNHIPTKTTATFGSVKTMSSD